MRILLVCLFALLACACVTDAPPPQTAAQAASATGGAADATGGAATCTSALARFRQVVAADAASGNLNTSVYARMRSDLASVEATCVAGQDAKALAQLASVRARYGYP